MKNIKFGILHFFSHLCIEVLTFFILTKYTNLVFSATLMLFYDLMAFVPQGIFGFLFDDNKKIPLYSIALGALLISIICFVLNLNAFIVVSFLSIGNLLIHVEGAEATLRSSKGKMTSPALFVAGGSFGLIFGKLLSNTAFPKLAISLLLIPLVLINIYDIIHKNEFINDSNLNFYNFSNEKIKPLWIIILATFIVVIRAFIGYGIPTSWNKEIYQTILLYVFMGLGKALGGFLIDKMGIRITAIISTLGAIPFLIFGDQIMIISIIGVMFFSMTMSITLALLVSKIKKYPGIAFGLTTLGLFIGTVPIFFFEINQTLSIILIISLSVLSFIILLFITRKGLNHE